MTRAQQGAESVPAPVLFATKPLSDGRVSRYTGSLPFIRCLIDQDSQSPFG